MSLANFIGSRLLSFQNPRVVCPPGSVHPRGRRNIIVATPRRSGTHILMDLIFNNIPTYRAHPLYVDLDQCFRRSVDGTDLMSQITADAGFILKTHLPIRHEARIMEDPQILRLIDEALVLTVRRDRDDVTRSMTRWQEMGAQEPAFYEALYDGFWDFWSGREDIEMGFRDLFDESAMQALMGRIAEETGTHARRSFSPAPGRNAQRSIYAHKALTRLLGRRAPVVNTTIHTLKG